MLLSPGLSQGTLLLPLRVPALQQPRHFQELELFFLKKKTLKIKARLFWFLGVVIQRIPASFVEKKLPPPPLTLSFYCRH